MITRQQDRAQVCAERIRAALRELRISPGGGPVLVAISGGPDSVCLLHALCALGVAVEAAHFDHQTREGESAADAEFVRSLTENLRVPFHLERKPILEESGNSDLSFEQYARYARYDFLIRTAKTRQCTAIATGHHADDQAETILMRILRGAAASGIAGIPPDRMEDGVRIVRPLLECTREEILAYLGAREAPYCTDHTNTDTRHFRNKVRHELLPYLAREYNPQVRAALLRLGESVRCENDFLDTEVKRAFAACLTPEGEIRRPAFADLHPALQRRLLLALAWRHGVDCPYDRVRGATRFIAESPAGTHFDLGAGLSISNGRVTARMARDEAHEDADAIALELPGVTEAFGRVFTVSSLNRSPEEDWVRYCSPARQVFDADALGSSLRVRTRRPGDRFVPFGMSGTRKLQDYFADLGMPVWQREVQLIVLSEERVAWIVGGAMDAAVAITPKTRNILQIEVADATP